MDKAVETEARAVEFGAEAYVSEAYARAEPDGLWRKVWQPACRVEELEDVGDYVVYDILDDTILITRSAPGELSAFFNVCAHRGKRLASGCGRAKQFRCSYHAWRYDLKGENVFVLDKEDWGGALRQERLNLPPVKVGTWGGFVWINMDPDCMPLEQYLQPLCGILDPFEFDKMRYRWRMRGVFDCNWKVAIEAFMEAYHVEGTHPQLTKYANFYTWSTADGLHSHKGFRERKPELSNAESNTYFRAAHGDDPRLTTYAMQEEIYRTTNASTTETFVGAARRLVDELPEGAPAAEVTAHWLAAARRDDAARGVIWPAITPEQLAAAGNSCHFFPNLAIGYGFTFALCYRARPYGYDPDRCIFEAFVIERFPEGQEPKPAIVDAPAEGWPPVLQQDFANMADVQRGMKSKGFRGNAANPLQEVTISNFHENLARFMGGAGAPRPIG
jgi:phenylpropionate dioxygenase-like ring-hydroxylating dioxygenase large terminal subunit